MFKSIFLLSLVFSPAAFAQRGNVGSEAQRLAAEIQREANRLSRDQSTQILAKFKDIRSILYGNGGGSPFTDFVCVARDNDNRAPYVFGLRDGINIVRVPGPVYGSVKDCQTAVESIAEIGVATLFCAPRDNDGRAPYQMTKIEGNGTLSKVARTITGTLSECQTLMSKLQLNRRGDTATFCTARDNDSRAPYQAVALELQSNQVQSGSETFSTLAACWTFLGVNP